MEDFLVKVLVSNERWVINFCKIANKMDVSCYKFVTFMKRLSNATNLATTNVLHILIDFLFPSLFTRMLFEDKRPIHRFLCITV